MEGRFNLEFEDPASTESDEPQRFECDLCGELVVGRPSSSGMFLWTRGDEVRWEEPPLCEGCSRKLSLGAYLVFEEE